MRRIGVLLTGLVVFMAGLVLVGAFAAAPLTVSSGSAAPGPTAVSAAAPDAPFSGEHSCHGPAQQDVDHAASVLPARPESGSDIAPLPQFAPVVQMACAADPVGPDRHERDGEPVWLVPSAPALQVFRI